MFKKSHLIFWAIIPLVVVYGFFNKGEILDINIGDTYFLITNSALIITISFFIAIQSCIYFLSEKFNLVLNRKLNFIHTIITLVGLLLFLFPINIFKAPQYEGFPKFPEELNTEMTLALITVVFVQILLVINLIIGLTKRKG